MADSDPSALDVVGQGLVRDLRTKLDATYFSDTVANDPDGIESLANVQTTTGSFDGSLDVFAEAVSLAENVGVLAVNPVDGLPNMALVGNPADVLAVSTTKVAVDANQLLLGSDSTQATARCVLRVGFGFPHEQAIVKVVIDSGS